MTDIAMASSDDSISVAPDPLDKSPLLYSAARETFAKRLAEHGPLVFISQGSGFGAAEVFVNNLPSIWHQEYTCTACANFFRQAADFVFVKEDGTLLSALWDEDTVPEAYRASIATLRKNAESGHVVNVLIPSRYDEYSKAGNLTRKFGGTFGYELKGNFNHFSITLPEATMAASSALRPGQAERIRMLFAHITEHAQLPALRTALAFLESGKLMRKDKFGPWVEWLIKLTEFAQDNKNRRQVANYLAREAVNAPLGWVEYRDSMVGMLLNELTTATDHTTPALIDRFNERADPENYQRAQAAASEGNIRAGAKAIQDLGLESALHRRWATIEDAKHFATWLPKPSTAKVPQPANRTGTVFDKLLPQNEEPRSLNLAVPPTAIAYHRFVQDVLPTAEKLEYQVFDQFIIGGLTTAVDDEALPLMKWDRPEQRNRFCHFVLLRPVSARQAGLMAGHWVNVRGVFHTAKNFGVETKELPNFVAIEGATFPPMTSHALFPEAIRSDLFPFRKTLEQYSNSTPLPQMIEQDKLILASLTVNSVVRVSVGDRVTTYRINYMEN